MLVFLKFPGHPCDVAVLRRKMFVGVNVCVSEFLGITEDKCLCLSIHKPHDDVRCNGRLHKSRQSRSRYYLRYTMKPIA